MAYSQYGCPKDVHRLVLSCAPMVEARGNSQGEPGVCGVPATLLFMAPLVSDNQGGEAPGKGDGYCAVTDEKMACEPMV